MDCYWKPVFFFYFNFFCGDGVVGLMLFQKYFCCKYDLLTFNVFLGVTTSISSCKFIPSNWQIFPWNRSRCHFHSQNCDRPSKGRPQTHNLAIDILHCPLPCAWHCGLQNVLNRWYFHSVPVRQQQSCCKKENGNNCINQCLCL